MPWQFDMGAEEYLDYCLERGAIPRYRGFKSFQELLKKGRITPDVTLIRVMYTGVLDNHYYVNEAGLFFLAGHPGSPLENPEEVLREDKNPDGWDIIKPKLKKIKER
jgi:hypothetical protein